MKGRNYFVNYEEQYDKIYRYCYFRLKNQVVAEDITQETFLRFLESDTYEERGCALHYLYTIARNLCIDEYRKPIEYRLTEEDLVEEKAEETWIEQIAVEMALKTLTEEEQELILLRYVNEVPVSVICDLEQCSRFALYRRMNKILKKLKKAIGEETKQKGGTYESETAKTIESGI